MRRSELVRPKAISLVILLAVIAALPFLVRPYQLDFLIFLFINVILVVSFRLVAITGEWSLAHAVIMGVGAYTSALLAQLAGLPVWLSIPVGGLTAALIAYVLSFSLFRMKGFYFLIGSFAAGEAIRLCWERFRDPFGGSKGIKRIPALEIDIPGVVEIDFGAPMPFYFFGLIVMILCLVIMYRLEHSRFGLNFHAIHWQDSLAQSVGINSRRFRTIAFVAAAFFAGIAGALLAHYMGAINPGVFGLGFMLSVLVWTIVGGMATFAGPIIGVTLLSITDESFRSFQEYRPLIYGVILIATVMFLPGGLESLPRRVMPLVARLLGRSKIASAAKLANGAEGGGERASDKLQP